MQKHSKKLILGVGNILLRDEGIGVRVVQYLQTQNLPPDVEVVDGGTAGADLIDVLADREIVVIIDAVDSDAPPGTILQLSPEDITASEANLLSLHNLDIPQTVAMTKLLGCQPARIVLLGVVPQVVEPGTELSSKLAALVPAIAEQAMNFLLLD